MSDAVRFTLDGKTIESTAGTLMIEAAKLAGIGIPSFCYYPGLSLQGACRMCLVEVEKVPKLVTACTLPVAEGMVIRTDTTQVAEARKAMLEFVLTNHPMDCPVCDKGGECELQDAAFSHGAGEGRFTETKVHFNEEQWSPVVFYDAPRCIKCWRCVRICDEGMGVRALGVVNRAATTMIEPNHGDHLDCDECGMCIDICPVGALTSGTYRYQTRPWEMNHVGTICTHCADGCKTTLGVRNDRYMRGDNRDASGVNGEFLCIKGRYGGDFSHHPDRLQSPMMRVDGQLQPVSWSKALLAVATKFKEVKSLDGKFAVIGSTRTTNEENYCLQRFARELLGTNNIDHHRTGDVVSLLDALAGRDGVAATTADLYSAKAIAVIGNDLAQQHSFLSYQIRANWRRHGSHIYAVTGGPVREDAYAVRSVRVEEGNELSALHSLREELSAEPELVILFGDTIKGEGVNELVAFGDSLGIPVKYVCLVDYSNSRGAMDMGLVPDLLPGYRPVSEAGLEPGLALPEILEASDLDVLWVVGANPLRRRKLAARNSFLVVQELFLTETALAADVVLPAASAYEKTGTVTNACGEVQKLRTALRSMGVKQDLQVFELIARHMGVSRGPWTPDSVFEEIRKVVPGYDVPTSVLATGGAAQAKPSNGRLYFASRPELIESARDTLFTSGTLGRYCEKLTSVAESPGGLYAA